MAYVIRGIVEEGSVPVMRTVRLYLRSTGALIDEVVSASTGEFEFVALPEFGSGIQFYLVALDDAPGEDFNALIYDRVTPVFESAGGAHRYWRINGISLLDPGGFLEISELQMLSGSVNVTGDATKTSSDTPGFGLLSALFDDNTSTRCHWTEAVCEAAGFWIQFDFGEGGDYAVDGVKQAGFDTPYRYMQAFTLQYSDDGAAWTTLGNKTGLAYPGNNTLSAEYTFP